MYPLFREQFNVPVLSAAVAMSKEYLDSATESLYQEKIKTILDELKKGEKLLTDEVLHKSEFISSVYIVCEAAKRTTQTEKIRAYTRLLLNGISQEQFDMDLFEEYIKRLEDLSIREVRILSLLYDIEKKYQYMLNSSEAEDKYQLCETYWDEFEKQAEEDLHIQTDILHNILTSLNRTGLYSTFTGPRWGGRGIYGYTTALFEDLRYWLRDDFG